LSFTSTNAPEHCQAKKPWALAPPVARQPALRVKKYCREKTLAKNLIDYYISPAIALDF
jgi:hypothetical protein